MKILLINDYGTPTGGAELAVLALRTRMRELGHDARLFASSARPLGAQSEADYECFGTLTRFRGLVQTFNPSAYLRLKRVLLEFQPDVVHVSMFLTQLSPSFLPLLRSYPTVYHAMWQRSVCPTGFKMLPTRNGCSQQQGLPCLENGCLPAHNWLLSMLQARLLSRWRGVFDRTLALSSSLSEQLKEGGIVADRIVALGVPVRPARKQTDTTPTACFAGRLSKEKGVDVLLHAFERTKREVKQARLLIAGDGPERERLKRMVADLKLDDSVQLLGHLPRIELEEAVSGVWIQVVPTLMREPYGMVVSEAMMRGTTVVVSAGGGPDDIIEHGRTGFLVERDNVQDLSKMMTSLLKDRRLTETVGERARAMAIRQLSEKEFADKVLNVFKELVNSGVVHAR